MATPWSAAWSITPDRVFFSILSPWFPPKNPYRDQKSVLPKGLISCFFILPFDTGGCQGFLYCSCYCHNGKIKTHNAYLIMKIAGNIEIMLALWYHVCKRIYSNLAVSFHSTTGLLSSLNQWWVYSMPKNRYTVCERRQPMDQIKIGRFIADCRKKQT